MPIRPEYRRYYGRTWAAYRRVLIERAGHRCAICRGCFSSRQLCAAHWTHDPRSSEIRIACFSCHARHDAPHSRAVARRTIARRFGQLWLLPEIERAPFPDWLAGRHHRRADELQACLF